MRHELELLNILENCQLTALAPETGCVVISGLIVHKVALKIVCCFVHFIKMSAVLLSVPATCWRS